MRVISQSFTNGGFLANKFAYRGDNISPGLQISEVPETTKSLALICHDPDAPGPDGFTHWLMWNISPSTTIIEEDLVPAGAIVGTNDWGTNNYGGPAPPNGTHRYEFTIYALNGTVDLNTNSNRTEMLVAIKPYVIESSTITGLYSA